MSYFHVQAQVVFNRQYYQSSLSSENNIKRCNSVIQTSDGGYFACGVGNMMLKMSAIKINSQGDTTWSFIADYGINGGDNLLTAIESNDGNFLVGGANYNAVTQLSSAVIIKLDKNTGDTIWTSLSSLPNHADRCYSIKQTSDNGYIFSGLRYNRDSLGTVTDNDVLLVKIDSLGIKEWEKIFGNSGYEAGLSVEITNEGGYMIFGFTDSFGLGYEDFNLIKTDANGDLLWQKTFGTQYHEYGNGIFKLQNGDYIIAGSSRISSDSAVACAIKINAEGTEIWNRRYPGTIKNMEFTAVKQLSNGELIVCGDEQGDTLNNSYYGILKSLDLQNGNIIWERQYHLFEDDSTQHYFYSMDTCSDGGLVMGGMIIDRRGINSIVGNSYWVVKTDCAGNEYAWDHDACPKFVGLEEIEKEALFNLYPNPSTGAVTLDYFIPQNAKNQSISFYDATGKLVQKVDFTGEGQIQLNIDCSGFSNGVYQCVLVSDGEVLQQGKMVLIK
jgi:outer membrane protein assembly factor BamB